MVLGNNCMRYLTGTIHLFLSVQLICRNTHTWKCLGPNNYLAHFDSVM